MWPYPLVAFLLLEAILLLPVTLFLLTGWGARRRIILSRFTDRSVHLYYRAFFPQEQLAGPSRPTHLAAFADDFDRRYGRWHYLAPLALFTATSSYLLLLSLNTAFRLLPTPVSWLDVELPTVAVAGVAGAYMWVLYEFISRERSMDFSTTHVNRATFRFAVAVPLGYALAQLAVSQPWQHSLAVLAGAFPTDAIFRNLRWLFVRRLGMDEPPADRRDRLDNLQGVDAGVAERFAEEGITTVSQLAYSDPIALTIRSGFRFDYVCDCISQALAWVYLEGRLAVAARFGIRGALEVAGLLDTVRKANPADPVSVAEAAQASQAIEDFAAAAQMTRLTVEGILNTIWEDRAVEFLIDIWEAVGERAPPATAAPPAAPGT
jgi:hypothetical protein